MLLAAMAWSPLFWFGLRLLGLHRFRSWLIRDRISGQGNSSQDEIIRVAGLVNIAARRAPFPSTCLSRSLLLTWILRRRGVGTDMRIGVRVTQGILDAHAWVEYAGMPINDRPDIAREFAPFSEIPSPGDFRSS